MDNISTKVRAENRIEVIDANIEDTIRALKSNIKYVNGLNDPKYRIIDLISGFDETNFSNAKIYNRLETAQKALKNVPRIKLPYFEGTNYMFIIMDNSKLYDNSDDLSKCLLTLGNVCRRAAVLPKSYLKKQPALNGDDYILLSLGGQDDAEFNEGISIIRTAFTSEAKYDEYQLEKARSIGHDV